MGLLTADFLDRKSTDGSHHIALEYRDGSGQDIYREAHVTHVFREFSQTMFDFVVL